MKGAVFLRVKCVGCEVHNSPPSSAAVKNAWHFTSTHIHNLVAWCLIMCRDKLYVEKCPKWALKCDAKCCCYLVTEEGTVTLAYESVSRNNIEMHVQVSEE